VADGHAAFLGQLARELHKFLAAFGAQFGERQADEAALNGGREAEIGLLDGLFDGLERAVIPRGDDELARFRRRCCRVP
jgi:hypothetical protein